MTTASGLDIKKKPTPGTVRARMMRIKEEEMRRMSVDGRSMAPERPLGHVHKVQR